MLSYVADLMTPELLDNRYKILQALGEGAMGMVYLVEDGTTGQALAMKKGEHHLSFGGNCRLRTQMTDIGG